MAESIGFRFLDEAGVPGVICFKLLEVAHAEHPVFESTAEQSDAEEALLKRMLGDAVATGALEAYKDCKTRTGSALGLSWSDPRMAAYVGAFVGLYDRIVQAEAPSASMQGMLLLVLVRDFGEYYGLLVDDTDGTKRDHIERIAAMLARYREASPETCAIHHRLPVNEMAADLLDYEISRTIEPDWVGVAERAVRGEQGRIADDVEMPVRYEAHRLRLRFSDVKDANELAALRMILPHFFVDRFDAFDSAEMARAFIERRQERIVGDEKESFAVLQLLKHFGGRLPESMPYYRVEDVHEAAKKGYRDLERRLQASQKAVGLRKRLSGAFGVSPISFHWDQGEDLPVRYWGDYDGIVFVPERVAIKSEDVTEMRFVCFRLEGRNDDDVFATAFQTTIDGALYDAFAATQDGFAKVPRALTRTFAIEPVVRFAFGVVHPGEEEAGTDVEEYALLRAFCALTGGVKSQTLQIFVLSDNNARAVFDYPAVTALVRRIYGV